MILAVRCPSCEKPTFPVPGRSLPRRCVRCGSPLTGYAKEGDRRRSYTSPGAVEARVREQLYGPRSRGR
jgi:hypothetical protein